jgi:serine/threonine protein kinase
MQALDKQLAKLEKISFASISVGDVVGRGRFKRVHKGRYKGRDVVVLRYVKDTRGFSPGRENGGADPRPEDERDKSYNELRILSLLAKKGTESFVPELFGVCHEPHSTIVVQEFASWGTLKSLLQNTSLLSAMTNLHRLHCSHQISKAMSFLESESVVHADLSCRNVLIFRFNDAPHQVIGKVSDFGLSVVLKEGTDSVMHRQPQATRWCAPETVFENKLSHRADMWSLGVTIWEMYADEKHPWPLRAKRSLVAGRLKDLAETGGSAEGSSSVDADFPKGSCCPPVVHAVLMSCLRADEFARPRFEQLTQTLGRIIEEGGEKDSQAEAIIAASLKASKASSKGKRDTKDFVLPPKSEAKEPDTVQWHAMCACAAVDENVKARIQALKAFPEDDRDVLLEAEGRLQRQMDQLAGLKKEASVKNEIVRSSSVPRELFCSSSLIQSGAATPTLRIPAPCLGVVSSAFSTPPRASIRIDSPRQVSPFATGLWTLWYNIGNAQFQHRDFRLEADAWEAFRCTKSAGISCSLRDPAGVEVGCESWKTIDTAPLSRLDGSFRGVPASQRVFCVTPPPSFAPLLDSSGFGTPLQPLQQTVSSPTRISSSGCGVAALRVPPSRAPLRSMLPCQ